MLCLYVYVWLVPTNERSWVLPSLLVIRTSNHLLLLLFLFLFCDHPLSTFSHSFIRSSLCCCSCCCLYRERCTVHEMWVCFHNIYYSWLLSWMPCRAGWANECECVGIQCTQPYSYRMYYVIVSSLAVAIAPRSSAVDVNAASYRKIIYRCCAKYKTSS